MYLVQSNWRYSFWFSMDHIYLKYIISILHISMLGDTIPKKKNEEEEEQKNARALACTHVYGVPVCDV